MNRLHRKEKVYPQIDKAFRFIDTYNRKTSAALWVHPFTDYILEAESPNEQNAHLPGLSTTLTVTGLLPPGLLPSGLLHPGRLHPGLLHPGLLHPGLLHPGLLSPMPFAPPPHAFCPPVFCPP